MQRPLFAASQRAIQGRRRRQQVGETRRQDLRLRLGQVRRRFYSHKHAGHTGCILNNI